MASKVLVKIPTVPFAQVQVNKKGPDVINASVVNSSNQLHQRSNNGVFNGDVNLISSNKDPMLRISQLEQNIRFLQEQHQQMLTSLHNEVETLRQRNRDLQFQLVFAKNGVILSTPSSPDDDPKPRMILSPKQANVTPLQIELFEKELSELKISLQEANTKNTYLSAIVDEQKKKIETFESEFNDLQNSTTTREQETELQQRLEESERLIRKLRRENEDQRREISSLRPNFQNGEHPHHGNRGQGNRRGGNPQQQHHRGQHRFPPLHSQSYWHQSNSQPARSNNHRSQQNQRSEHISRSTNSSSRMSINVGNDCNDQLGPPSISGTTLPSLRNNSDGANYSAYNGNRRSGYHGGNNGNHYRDSERKYRGQNRGNKS